MSRPKRQHTPVERPRLTVTPPADEVDQVEGSELVDTPVSQIAASKTRWLLPDRIPFGQVTILQGDKGVGKSTLLRALAAHVTGGPRLSLAGRGKRSTGAVLWYAGEESLESRIRPGLEAAGADLNRVHAADTSGEQFLALPNDCPRLARRIVRHGALLVVVDPLFSFLDGIDLEGPTLPARHYMRELGRVARQTGAALLLTRNLTKSRVNGALAAGRGCAELGNAARSVLHLSSIPGERHFALAVAACNDGRAVPAVSYRLVDRDGQSAVELDGTLALSADDLAGGEETALEQSQVERAKLLIRSLVPEGRLPSKVIRQKAEDAIISVRTLQLAAGQLGVRYQREGTREATTVYWLPPRGGWG